MGGFIVIFCTALRLPRPASIVAYLSQNRHATSVSETLPAHLDLWSEKWEQFTIQSDTSGPLLLNCIAHGDGQFDEAIRRWIAITNSGCLSFFLFNGWRQRTIKHLQQTRFIIEIEYSTESNPDMIVLLMHYFAQKYGGLVANQDGW